MTETVITAIVAPTLLFIFQLIKESRQGVKKDIHEIRISNLRLEILNAIQHNPEDEITILALYDKYVSLGGNSYIKAYVARWKDEHKKQTAMKRRRKNA